jgi:energy-coupling factor transporter ATP-binding protein EcfA2
MALTSFRVGPLKSIHLAEAIEVPPVMIIAGPNGVGKSTLLFAIKDGAGVITQGTRVLYQGPHRAIRSTQVQRRWLGGGVKWFLDLLTEGDVSGYEGLQFHNSSRTPGNIDEAGSTIKHTLGKIENRRQSILAGVVDRSKAAGTATLDLSILPDIYKPLRTLTQYLLPHLTFSGIDFSNEDSIRCLWSRTDASGTIEIDIDDLSSGEKSIVILFLPLLEDQIRKNLDLLENIATSPGGELEAVREDRVMLIDEPEQHLHPDLQAKILAYIRRLAAESNVQFVITTHSPTILDQAFDTELFALSAPSGDTIENQLRRIATNAERLETLKQLAGSAYFLTTGRVVVCVEGESALETSEPTDVALLEIMYPRATAFTLVPTKGKGNVITTVTQLRNHMPEETFRIRIRGLVDPDQSIETVTGIELLPVCMIENLLLDPTAIYAYLAEIGVPTFSDAELVRNELDGIAIGLRDQEIELRVARRIKPQLLRVGGATMEDVKARLALEVSKLQNLLPSDHDLQDIVTQATSQVDDIIAKGRGRDLFRGKTILRTFYSRHIERRNIGYKLACIEIAKRVAGLGVIASQLDPIFDRLAS